MNDKVLALARAYIEEMNGSTSDHAWAALDSMINKDPEHAWTVLLAVIDEVSERFLHQVGAGPLEELLCTRPDFFGRAVKQASGDSKFREALRYVRGAPIPPEWRPAYDTLWLEKL